MTSKKSVAAANSVIQRVYQSVEVLATGPGDVRSRLTEVGNVLFFLQTSEFPEETREDFKWIVKSMTRYDAKGQEGSLIATMSRIKNSTGQRIANRIFVLYCRLQEIRGHAVL